MAPPGRTHPTFVELGTNEPLYVHREGSNVVNGRYFVDKNPKGTIAHYSSFRRVDVPALRKLYEAAMATPPAEAIKTSPLKMKAGSVPLPKYYTLTPGRRRRRGRAWSAQLNAQGYWLAPLGYNSHPVPARRLARRRCRATSRRRTSATRPTPRRFRTDKLMGISIEAYIRNMGVLIRALDPAK